MPVEALVADAGRVEVADRAELVASAARDTKSIDRAARASIQIAGNSYQVTLPPAKDAGFDEGDPAPVHPAPGRLVITTDEVEASRLAADLADSGHGEFPGRGSRLVCGYVSVEPYP